MAKKTVATFKSGEGGRTYSKVIKMVKSPKTGAYVFQEEMIPNDDVICFLSLSLQGGLPALYSDPSVCSTDCSV